MDPALHHHHPIESLSRSSSIAKNHIPPVYVVGYPSYVGGADTELWHTLKLWRQIGIEVRIIPTWQASVEWRERLEKIGVPTIEAGEPDALQKISGLNDSIVVSFCNGEFLKSVHLLREMRCKIVWVNCMTWVFQKEIEHYEEFGGFDAYVFQSSFQRECLFPKLQEYGVQEEHCAKIRGAFAAEEFPFAPTPHEPGKPFVYGRIARPDLDKWSSNFWPIYSSIPYSHKQARVMAWSHKLTAKCGPPPDWAEPLAPNAVPARSFLESLHCMFPINGGARENWPRSGLEAMASGVPVVAQNLWGWKEMIEHGVTGFLGSDDCELAYYAAVLAYDEELRIEIVRNARQRLVDELANSSLLSMQWYQLFQRLTARETQHA